MIAAWKRQAIEGMANTFSGVGDAAKAVSESEVEKLHAKIGQLVVERDLYEGLSVKGHTDRQQRPQRDRLERGIKRSGTIIIVQSCVWSLSSARCRAARHRRPA
jgi:hypothetical protein